MKQLTDKWENRNGTWYRLELIERWVRYAELTCKICDKKFKTRHESQTCGEKCRAIFRWNQTPPEKRWTSKGDTFHNGYKMIHVPECGRKVYEHRYVMEKHLGRELETNENIHHINGDRSDNRLENLVIINRGDHNTLHKSEEVKHRKRDDSGHFI